MLNQSLQFLVSKICLPAGGPLDDKNWPPFFPIIHHDIANEIPVHAQRLQYLAFASWLGMLVYLITLYMFFDYFVF